MTLESAFQRKLIEAIELRFPDAIVLKSDSSYIQGIPDLLILNNDHWAALECKRSRKESPGPNQDYYVGLMNAMSYAAFVYPENMDSVLDDLQRAL